MSSSSSSYYFGRVSTRTSIPAFTKKQFSTMRRFSDFLGLHDLLVEKYLRRGRIIPPAPEKNLIGKLAPRFGHFSIFKNQRVTTL